VSLLLFECIEVVGKETCLARPKQAEAMLKALI